MEDKLILLKRINPIEYEIHKGEIRRAENLILTTKDKDLATKLVNCYNQKVTYTEEEVVELLKAFKVTMEFAKQCRLPCDILELFEDCKKK